MRIDAITIFPRMLEAPLADGIVQRAREAGLVDIHVHDLRDFTDDRHRSVDDSPFGGGPGMVMKAEPFARALDAIAEAGGRVAGEGEGPVDDAAGQAPRGDAPLRQRPGTAVVLLSPRGRRFDQATARRYAGLDRLVLLCGRYEGIDERVAQQLASEELSLGDFVLTGGETAALAVVEATVRLLPGALGDEGSAESDSFGDGTLDWPHYTRPADWRGHAVPEVLLSGDHARIARWRRKQALRATRDRRPDLFAGLRLSAADERILREIEDSDREGGPGPLDNKAVVGLHNRTE